MSWVASRLLHGSEPPAISIDPASIPLAEGLRLLLNRLAEASAELSTSTEERGRWIDKVLMAVGDCTLLATGGYTASYRLRARRFVEHANPWPLTDSSRQTIRMAYERKLTGAVTVAPSPALVAGLVRQALDAVLLRVVGIHFDPVEGFVRRYTLAAARQHELLRYLPPVGPAATYEALIVVDRVRRAGLRVTPRALRPGAPRPPPLPCDAGRLSPPLPLACGGRCRVNGRGRTGDGVGGHPLTEPPTAH